MTYWSNLSSNTGTDKRMNYTIFVKIINLSHQWVMFLLNHFHYSVYFQCQSLLAFYFFVIKFCLFIFDIFLWKWRRFTCLKVYGSWKMYNYFPCPLSLLECLLYACLIFFDKFIFLIAENPSEKRYFQHVVLLIAS